jgi:2-polyprenyl-3-methyl-5-hydroxy-6-metoxy-1,4-benzoquinol methylase
LSPWEAWTEIVAQEDAPTVCKDTVVDLYERYTREDDRDRSRSLQEREWLDRFLLYVRPAGTVLDLGCGMGEPIARYLLDRGFRVVGVDGSLVMIELC